MCHWLKNCNTCWRPSWLRWRILLRIPTLPFLGTTLMWDALIIPIVQGMTLIVVGHWKIRFRTWSAKGCWSSHKMVILNSSAIPQRHAIWSDKFRRKGFLFIRIFKLYFSFDCLNTYFMSKLCYFINASHMSVLNQYIRIRYIQTVFIFLWCQLLI